MLSTKPQGLKVGANHPDLAKKYPFIEISQESTSTGESVDNVLDDISLLSPEEIEENKDKMNLAKEVGFVSEHIQIYLENLKKIFSAQKVPKDVKLWAEDIQFLNENDIVQPQINEIQARGLLARMPKVLKDISSLENIEFAPFGSVEDINKVPVPLFDKDGNFDQRLGVPWVNANDFPEKGQHPQRLLIGLSNGKNIFPTPIPESIYKDISNGETAALCYQIHVFLHEFFHSTEFLLRNGTTRAESEKNRHNIIFECDGEKFSLQDWWKEWENLYTENIEPTAPSLYASGYEHQLTAKMRDGDESDYGKFESATAEQICESFVGYHLGLLPNKNKDVSFKIAHPKKWTLIDKLSRSILINS